MSEHCSSCKIVEILILQIQDFSKGHLSVNTRVEGAMNHFSLDYGKALPMGAIDGWLHIVKPIDFKKEIVVSGHFVFPPPWEEI